MGILQEIASSIFTVFEVVDNILQGSKINSSHKQLTQSILTVSQLTVQNIVKRIQQNVKTANETHHSRA